MKLSELIKNCKMISIADSQAKMDIDPEIVSITSDSRQVVEGSMFIAVKGEQADGHDYIEQALKSNAAVVIAQKPYSVFNTEQAQKTILVDDTRAVMGPLADAFYNHPSKDLTLVGVTGTNGKTTVTWLLEQIFTTAGFNTGVIGTVNIRYNGQSIDSGMTTPDAIDLQKTLSDMKNAGVTHVIMEVSSHGLSLNRVDGCCFDAGIFTNLTQDHLDFHSDMSDYFDAKKRLFTRFLGADTSKNGIAVLNIDDEKGALLSQTLTCPTITVSTQRPCDIFSNQTLDTIQGLSGTLNLPENSFSFRSPLTGRFNLENILCAAGAAHALDIKSDDIISGIESCTAIPGRLEKIDNAIDRYLFVDYAHTPDALESILQTLKLRAPKRLITVFGCGGDRDSAKRPLMGEIAGRYSDIAIVTSDNPRTENPDAIIQDILAGMTEFVRLDETAICAHPFKKGYIVESDRSTALKKAIQISKPDDIIVAAGKGHETYQILNSGTIHFDDKEVLDSHAQSLAKQFLPIEWKIEDIKNALGSEPVLSTIKTEISFARISTDSRCIQSSDLFLALSGDNFDGHTFIPALIEKGIKGFVTQAGFSNTLAPELLKKATDQGIVIFETSNTLTALGQLACFQRERADVKLVGITGSSGKTTTRKITQQIFQTRFHTLATQKNFNNEIGVPLTLLNLSKSHEYAIIEMGMNHAGEIERISKIAQPDIAIITNVAGVHLEGLGTVENVAHAKAEIFCGMKENSTAILNADDTNRPILETTAQKTDHLDQILFFGSADDADMTAKEIQTQMDTIQFTIQTPKESILVEIASPASFMVDNCLAAAGAALAAGIDTTCIQKGIGAFTPEQGRMNIYPLTPTTTIIDDTYNANPASVTKAIETLATISGDSARIAVLGDMLELGEASGQLHLEIGQTLGINKIDQVFLFGKESKQTMKGAMESGIEKSNIFHGTKEQIIHQLSRTLDQESCILVKGSRGMSMEVVINGLKETINNQRIARENG